MAGAAIFWVEYVTNGKFELAVERLFGQEQVDYIQVHSTAAGCFTFRIERADRPVTAGSQNLKTLKTSGIANHTCWE